MACVPMRQHPNFSRLHKGAYTTAVNNTPAHTKSEFMTAVQHAKTHDDVDTLHLKLHPIPSVSCDHASDAVPTLGDDDHETVQQLITETKSSSSIKMHKCATTDDSSLGDDIPSDCTSTTASVTNSCEHEDDFHEGDTLDSDENAVTSWSTENAGNSTNDIQ